MNELIQKLADALEKDASEMLPIHRFREYEEWDSLVVLAVIAMIKQDYGITIPRKEFDTLETIDDLYRFLTNS